MLSVLLNNKSLPLFKRHTVVVIYLFIYLSFLVHFVVVFILFLFFMGFLNTHTRIISNSSRCLFYYYYYLFILSFVVGFFLCAF